MRELTEQETELVVGGDGIALPGGNYISNTRVPMNYLGVYGAGMTALSAGIAIGSGINYGYGRATGGSLAHDMGGWAYENIGSS